MARAALAMQVVLAIVVCCSLAALADKMRKSKDAAPRNYSNGAASFVASLRLFLYA